MKTATLILFALLAANLLSAQSRCASDSYMSQLSADPVIAQSIRQSEQLVINTLKNKSPLRQRDTAANELITIPVVVHVLYNNAVQNISDAQIMSQLVALNKDFANLNEDAANRPAPFAAVAASSFFRFCLAQVDPAGKRTTGIIRKATNVTVFTADDAMKSNFRGGDDAWDAKRYLNIWVCNLGGRSLGYATLPGSPADKDGVVISFDVFGTTGYLRAPFNKGRTATHEVGHWMGLKHIWGDTDCGDDGVEDTPRQKSYNFGCPSFPRVTECSQTADGDMFMNFMDFSDDACMNMFTVGQKKRMRALFASGNTRNSFLNSLACDSNQVQAGPVAADTIPVQPAPVAVENSFRVYPNPVQSQLTIQYKSNGELAVRKIRIVSVQGVQVFSGELSKSFTEINTARLVPGIYIVHIENGRDWFTTKIVKQ